MSNRSIRLLLVLDAKPEEQARIAAALTAAGFDVIAAPGCREALDGFYAEPPQCVVLEHGLRGEDGRSLLDAIKSDNIYGHLPAVLMVSAEDLERGLDWFRVPADEYVTVPFSDAELVSRVRMCLARGQRDVNANPLTGLPGNLTITREAERRLASGEPFAFAYVDLDRFKAYNDRYGFSRGDEMLRMTARVIANAMRSLDPERTYVGHVGGDDFVFITPPELITRACERIVRDFDLVTPDFYDEEDRKKGEIHSVDRQGNPHVFPFIAVSIGVVDTGLTQVDHVAALFERVTEVKALTKKLPGSNFVIDRRR